MTTTFSTCSVVTVAGRPGRSSSAKPSSRCSRNRARHLPTVYPQPFGDGRVGTPVGALQDDPRTLGRSLRGFPMPGPPGQLLALIIGQDKFYLRASGTRHTQHQHIGPESKAQDTEPHVQTESATVGQYDFYVMGMKEPPSRKLQRGGLLLRTERLYQWACSPRECSKIRPSRPRTITGTASPTIHQPTANAVTKSAQPIPNKRGHQLHGEKAP